MTDRAQMGPTPKRPMLTLMGALIGMLIANETTVAVGVVVALAWTVVVWWQPIREVASDD